MDAAVWGPAMWQVLHTLAHDYNHDPNPKERNAMHAFLVSLTVLLPCPSCREHYKAYMEQNLLDNALQNRESLEMWVLQLHNSVNLRIGKPTYTYEKWHDEIEAQYGGLPTPKATNTLPITQTIRILWGVLILAVILLLIYGVRALLRRTSSTLKPS